GIRLEAHSDISRTKAFRTGLIEVQDAGSQVLSFLTGAKAGMAVADYCAGAGGKTLALADRLGLQGGGKSRLVACDNNNDRLKRMDRRLERAKLDKLVERHVIDADKKWESENRELFDRVLVDAPCSGSGTWRRHPEQKNRVSQELVFELTKTQDEILGSACELVKPNGRLIYATCSVLEQENEERIKKFLETHKGFKAVDWREVWVETMNKTPLPEAASVNAGAPDSPFLRLSPAQHGSDGFFVAVLTKVS
ncbi:MAG: RsmB/NOP family class I SAM-dependent RNA methyltransferase, partial [Rhodospirillaceae bacterium]|nr:RsmB/NOP family class I SAM-dependent RNA methyltransferase [Rhodospirillaceae bacterium]